MKLNLTVREIAVFNLLIGGLSNKEIANKLGCVERTVKAHTKQIFDFYCVPDRNKFYAKVIKTLQEKLNEY